MLLAACHSGWPSDPAPPRYGPPPNAYPQGGYSPSLPGADSQGGYASQPAPGAYQPPPAAPVAAPLAAPMTQPAPPADPFSALLRSLGSGPTAPGFPVPTTVPTASMNGLPWPFPSVPG